jgi:uncharacterized protein GlcG (DUF336 family)
MSLMWTQQAVITQQAALKALAAASDKAEALGARVNIAVVDSSGLLAGFVRMPGAFLMSIDMAQKKARCAAGLGFEADVTDQILAHEPPRVREGLLSHPDFTLIRGGLPIRIAGQLIGAIGVSGGSEAQDVACAQAGLEAVIQGEQA